MVRSQLILWLPVCVCAVNVRDVSFSYVPASLRCGLRVDSVAEYSVSDADSAEALATAMGQIIRMQQADQTTQLHNRGDDQRFPFIVTDACACIGGNTLSFARHFHAVHATEVDPQRCDMLKHNCQISGANSPNKATAACRLRVCVLSTC